MAGRGSGVELTSLLLRFSWGPMVSPWKRLRMASMSPEEYWNSLLLELKMTSAIWQSHSTDSSIAFFISPFFRFVNVTCTQRPKCKHERRQLQPGSRHQFLFSTARREREGAGPALSNAGRLVNIGADFTWRLRSSAMRSMRIFLRPTVGVKDGTGGVSRGLVIPARGAIQRASMISLWHSGT